MAIEKLFKTKTGYCHIFPDKIILSRDGIIGNVAKVPVGNNISRILLIYGILSLFLLYSSLNRFQNGQTTRSVLYGVGALFLIYGIFTSLNNSAAPIIERSKIKEVKLKKAYLGITRSRFEVMFEDNNGKVKKRLIMLPGSLTGGKIETDKAVRMMIEEKLLKE